MSSSLAASATHPLSNYFHVTNQEQLVLPRSIFLAEHTFGPLLFGPLSESFGRKWTMICLHALHCVYDRQRPRTKLACSDCIPIICRHIWSLPYSSGWRDMCRRIPQSQKPRTSYGTIHRRYYFWPCIGSRNFRLHIYCDLALVLLDRRNRCRPSIAIPTLYARNLRTRNPQTACTKATQRDRRRLHCGFDRARENRHRPHRHRCANSSNPHDLLRAARPLFLHPLLLRLRHLLHLLPSLPNHLDRHLPMLGLASPPGPSAQHAVGA